MKQLGCVTGAVFGLLACPTAFALGLGAITVRSHLNEPLVADIAVIEAAAGEAEGLSAKLPSTGDMERVGIDVRAVNTRVEYEVRTSAAGRTFIRITTDEAVRDPLVVVALEARWSKGRVLRSYSIPLDAVGLNPGAPSASDAEDDSRQARGRLAREETTSTQPAARAAETRPQTAPAPAARETRAPAPAQPPKPSVAAAPPPKPQAAPDTSRAELAALEAKLKEKERESAALRTRLDKLEQQQPENARLMAQKDEEIEAAFRQIEEMRRRAAEVAVTPTVAASASPPPPAAPEAPITAATAPVATPEAAPDPASAPVDAAATTPAPAVSDPAPEPAPAPVPAEAVSEPVAAPLPMEDAEPPPELGIDWYGASVQYAAAGILALLLAWLLLRRWQASRGASAFASPATEAPAVAAAIEPELQIDPQLVLADAPRRDDPDPVVAEPPLEHAFADGPGQFDDHPLLSAPLPEPAHEHFDAIDADAASASPAPVVHAAPPQPVAPVPERPRAPVDEAIAALADLLSPAPARASTADQDTLELAGDLDAIRAASDTEPEAIEHEGVFADAPDASTPAFDADASRPEPEADDDGAPDASVPEPEAQEPARDTTLASSLSDLGMDPVATKLELAQAYLEMGDPDAARHMLNEVLDEGDVHQRDAAVRLVAKIANG